MIYRSLLWSYSNWWLPVSYKQVAPNGAKKCRAEHRADVRAGFRAELRAVPCADDFAEGGAEMICS